MVAVEPTGTFRQSRIIITNLRQRKQNGVVTLRSDDPSPRSGIARLVLVQHASKCPCLQSGVSGHACFWDLQEELPNERQVLCTCWALHTWALIQVSSRNHKTWGRCLNVRTFQILSTKAYSILFCNSVAKAFAKQPVCCHLELPYKDIKHSSIHWILVLLHFSGNPFSLHIWCGSSPNFPYLLWNKGSQRPSWVSESSLP